METKIKFRNVYRRSQRAKVKFKGRYRLDGIDKDGKRIIHVRQPRCKLCGRFYRVDRKNYDFAYSGLLLCSECKKRQFSIYRKTYNKTPKAKKRRNEYQRKYCKEKYHSDSKFKKRKIESTKKWIKNNRKKWNEVQRKYFKRRYDNDSEFRELVKLRDWIKTHANELEVGDVF